MQFVIYSKYIGGRMAKHNLCVIGLYKTVKPLANRIADTLDMYFADIDELIAFDLLDVKLTQEVCGREYLLKIEKNKVKTVTSYENTLLSLDYSVLNNDSIIENIKDNCVIIYLKYSSDYVKSRLKKTDGIEYELFEDRDYICTQMADIIVHCDDLPTNKIIEQTTTKLQDYYNV